MLSANEWMSKKRDVVVLKVCLYANINKNRIIRSEI